MKTSVRKCPARIIHAALASTLFLSMFAADSASALDPRPRTYRERAKHDFRDAQLGLCHPADGTGQSKSMKCSEARRKFDVAPNTKKD